MKGTFDEVRAAIAEGNIEKTMDLSQPGDVEQFMRGWATVIGEYLQHNPVLPATWSIIIPTFELRLELKAEKYSDRS